MMIASGSLFVKRAQNKFGESHAEMFDKYKPLGTLSG